MPNPQSIVEHVQQKKRLFFESTGTQPTHVALTASMYAGAIIEQQDEGIPLTRSDGVMFTICGLTVLLAEELDEIKVCTLF